MYDERTLYLKVYSSFLATIEKEKKDVVIQAITEGIAEGWVEGIEKYTVSNMERKWRLSVWLKMDFFLKKKVKND